MGVRFIQHVGVGSFGDLATFFVGQRYCTDTGSCIADAGVADGADIFGNTFNNGSGAGLFFDAVFEITFAQGVLFEVSVGAGCGVTAVHADRHGGQFAGYAKLPPCGDISAARK